MKLYTAMPALKGASVILNKQQVQKESTLPTFIYFWSMSCPQCKQSIEKLNDIQTLYQNRLSVYAVHMPREKSDYSIEQLNDTVQRLQLTIPIYVDNELTISDAFKNQIVPSYYLFDELQRLRFFKVGFLATKSLQQKIERIL
ncbi:TlpA family protein disulfide reductase [Solibacillus daqui]|uniref:TlpA family protein disulfide reductase n=1 Tax=Solibacillus daqui TaxID=2912187 RepID=UPI0023664FE5|nr:TlpA disulfide reductase family protein [Solibacillus daqui]